MTFEEHDLDLSAARSPSLELDYTPRVVPIARFISARDPAFDAAAIAVCPYCATPASRHQHACSNCGFRGAAIMSSRSSSYRPPPPPDPVASSPAAPSRVDGLLDAIRTIPFEVWKRVPVYAFLAMLFGNGCRCGGLSASVNASLVVLLAVGLIGVAASFQRNP